MTRLLVKLFLVATFLLSASVCYAQEDWDRMIDDYVEQANREDQATEQGIPSSPGLEDRLRNDLKRECKSPGAARCEQVKTLIRLVLNIIERVRDYRQKKDDSCGENPDHNR